MGIRAMGLKTVDITVLQAGISIGIVLLVVVEVLDCFRLSLDYLSLYYCT